MRHSNECLIYIAMAHKQKPVYSKDEYISGESLYQYLHKAMYDIFTGGGGANTMTPRLYYIFLSQETELSQKAISEMARKSLLTIASEDLQLPVEDICIERGEYGKPYIKDHEEWQFNISHTDGLIVIAVADCPIGIDVEKIREPDYRIAKRFFTKAENEYIGSDIEGRDVRFFEIWTKKEAYIKYIGKGLGEPLGNFDVTSMPEIYQTLRVGEYILTLCQCAVHT